MKICFRFLRTWVEPRLILLLVAVVCIGGMTACSSVARGPLSRKSRDAHRLCGRPAGRSE